MRPIDADKLIQELKDKNIPIVYENPVYGDLQNYTESVIDSYKGIAIDTINSQPTVYDVDKVVEQLEERTSFLKDCSKYGNQSEEQERKSYDTMMMYEIADFVEDLIDIVKSGGITE